MKDIITFSKGSDSCQVCINCLEIGSDLLVAVEGGQKPHVGAIAVAIPRPSLSDAQKVSSSVSIFTLTAHKEDELARAMAGKIASSLNRVTVLTAGIHVEQISEDMIKIIEANAMGALESMLHYFRQGAKGKKG